MGKALYRKHRSTSFSEVVGQEHITKTLTNAITADRVSHAYFLTGPRGVGKTSVARILAHEVNKLEYSDSATQIDIIEIDAASNRRIDEIRELRDKVHIPPTSLKYKVYIIDEVHMLTKEAFNALLKTLEEPPEHCIFILATTEAHKVPDTIISRTQRFDFRKIDSIEIVNHLRDIAKKEKIDISDEALMLIARHGGGSFRDSIGMLDQLSSQAERVNEDIVREVLGMPSAGDTEVLLKSVETGDVSVLGKTLGDLEDSQISIDGLCKSLSQYLVSEVVEGNITTAKMGLLKGLLDVESSPQPWHKLLVVLVEAMQDSDSVIYPRAMINSSEQPKPESEIIPKGSGAKKTPSYPVAELSTLNSAPSNPKSALNSPNKAKLDTEDIYQWWPMVLDKVKIQAASMYTTLRLATPKISDGNIELGFQFPLHQKKLDNAKNKDSIAGIILDVTARVYTVTTTVDPLLKKNASSESPEPAIKPNLSSISNIFGGVEVLES